MKKYIVLCSTFCLALGMTSCKSSESAYKKAYEKAKQYDTQTAQQQQPATQTYEEPAVVAPVQTRPATETSRVDNYDNVAVRQMSVSLVNGSGLKAYSVVVGSMSMMSNAEALQKKLKSAGYDAQIAQGDVHGQTWYRVVAATFNDKASAAQSRDQLRATYPDAWLLYNVQ